MPYSRFVIILACATLIDAVVFLAVFFFPKEARAGTPPASHNTLRRLLQALLTVAAAFALKLPLCSALGLNFFGLIYLAYLDVFVLVPLAGLLALTVSLLGRHPDPGPRVATSLWIVSIAAVLLAPLGAYATFVEPYRLKLETPVMPLPPERSGTSPVRIGILADLQAERVTDYELTAVKRLMAQHPDLVLIPGDLFQNPWGGLTEQAPAMHDLLCQLTTPAGAYIVLGDVDIRSQIESLIVDTPAKLLYNAAVHLTIGDRRVTLGGIELDCNSSAARETMYELETAPGNDDIRILLAHRPDAVLCISPRSRIDLVIAGHTHGGQVVIPWFGPLVTLSRVPRHVAEGGLHELKGDHIYVSRGVGSERGQAPLLRLNCPPEITLLMLGQDR